MGKRTIFWWEYPDSINPWSQPVGAVASVDFAWPHYSSSGVCHVLAP